MRASIKTRKLLLLGIFLLSFATSAWSQKVSLNFSHEKTEKVLSAIKTQTGLGLVFSDQLLDVNRVVSISVKDVSIEEALTQLLTGTQLTFEIKNKKIYFVEKKAEQAPSSSSTKKRKVTGIVADKNGETIIGANVIEKGSTGNGTITDIDGNFTLEVADNAPLLVSFIGFTNQEVSTKGKNTFNIILNEDTQTLDEVVVVGYGVQKKVNLTGAVAAIDSKALENRPVSNVTNAIQGLLPGVTVISGSGQPGNDGGTIRVRGVGTMNNSNPMYVVDGMTVSSINEVDPNDIASISVLKDASSAAIYGSRAANGVILITTKKGSDKAPTLKYDGYAGWQKPTALPEYLHSWEYATLYNKAMVNEKKNPIYTNEEIEKFRNGSDPDAYPDTDWQGLFYKTGMQHSHRAEISGGSDKMSYMFSAGYLNQDGIIKNSQYDRYSIRANINAKIKEKISVGMNLAFTEGRTLEPISGYTGDMSNIFFQINTIAPFIPYKTSNGYYGYANDGNPLAYIDEGNLRTQKQRTLRTIGNVSYEPIKGLKIQEIIGYEYRANSEEKFIKDIQYYNWKTGEPTKYQGPNSQTDERKDRFKVNLQTLVTYNNTFGKHTVGGLLGFEQEYNREDWTKGYRKDFLNNDLGELNAGSPAGQEAKGSGNEYALRSFFGRVTYDYDNRYLIEANIRRDGTSRIFKETRWGTFPSFSAAWRIINESFMESTRNVLSDLKVRGGWGVLGNQSIDNYSYQSVLEEKNYSFGGNVVQGVAPVKGANRNLRWETTETANIGVDLGLFGGQYTFSVDAYQKNTYDILLKLPVSWLYGLEAPYQNAGKVKNTGFEMTAGYKLTLKEWNFQVSANAAYNKNEVTDYKNGLRDWSDKNFNQEGYAINSYGGYIAEGIFQTEEEVKNSAIITGTDTAPGDIKYRDINKDGKIDGEDRTYIGSTMPKWTFGLNLFAEWKGLDATLLFQGAADVQGYLSGPATVGEMLGDKGKPSYMYRDCWDAETNPNGKFPRAFSGYKQNNSIYTPSTFWMVNSSYLRLKNFQLGYTLPKAWCEFAGISRVRVYYSGQNLLTFSKFEKGFDPESPEGGSSYPQLKTNTFGLNITF